jgi:hypothetical protein
MKRGEVVFRQSLEGKMVRLFFWGQDAFGHAAVLAGDQYLSFHPKERSKLPLNELLGVEGRFGKYGDEIESAEQMPQSVFSNSLDVKKVEQSIFDIRSRTPPHYNFLTNNCSHMALRVLHAGLSDHDKNVANALIDGAHQAFGKPVSGVGTIDKMVDFIIVNGPMLAPQLRLARPVAKGLATFVAAVVGGKRMLIASPADVVRFVRDH